MGQVVPFATAIKRKGVEKARERLKIEVIGDRPEWH
jgi:hypothetical protein